VGFANPQRGVYAGFGLAYLQIRPVCVGYESSCWGATMKDNVFEDGHLDALSAFRPLGPTRPALASANGSVGAASIPRGSQGYRRLGKRIADILFVVISLPVTLPVTVLCALALWIEGGQPFYQQRRLGRGGRSFSILKLRTMCREADQLLESYLAADPALRAEWDRTQKLKNDPRITPVGAFLRKTSLDELPQFLNVIRGDMSVVGPRPMMPEQLPMYPDPLPYFDMLPGITGQWQVSDRNENSFAHRSSIDAAYHTELSFKEDLRILFKTVGVVMRRTGY